MALIDNFAAASDPRVIAQVTAAIHLTASNVYGESTTVTGHTTRAAFSNKVSTGQINLTPLILDACVYGTLTAASTDAAVETAVSALWNEWAGV